MDEYTATEEAYKNGYDKGYADATPKWISVEEMLPNVGVRVLAYYDNGDMRTVVSCGGFSAVSFSPGVWTEVTHWMPLPEPPKEVE